MLKKSDKKMTEQAYWCVVSGSDIWVDNDQFPFGSADELGLSVEHAICIGRALTEQFSCAANVLQLACFPFVVRPQMYRRLGGCQRSVLKI